MSARRGRRGPAFAAVVVAVSVAACSSGDGSAGGPGTPIVRYDSAGVEIVEAGSATLERPLDWTVSESPSLALGASPTDPRYQFLEIVAATRFPDGRIAVADQRDVQVRIYSPEGVFGRAVGREGEGPGEFVLITGMRRGRGDSLVVFDRAQQRVTIFGDQGALGRSEQLPNESFVDAVTPRPDGGWFVYSSEFGGRAEPGGIARDTLRYLASDGDLDAVDAIGWIPGIAMASVGTPVGTAYTRAPLSPTPVQDSWKRCVVASAGDGRDIVVFASSGGIMRRVRIDGTPPAITEADRDAWFEDLRSRVPPEDWDVAEEGVRALPFPEFLPWAADLHVDAIGFTWVQRFELPPTLGTVWFVIAPSGEPLGTISLPEPLKVLEIGADYLLGVRTDALGDESIVLYELSRPGDLNPSGLPEACEP